MNLTPLRVIIVEDHISVRLDLEDFFQHQPGFIVIAACGTVSDAIVLMNTTKPDLLLLDIRLPDGTGFDILEQMPGQTKVIFLTAHNEYATKAICYGAIDYLLKPFDRNELTEALQKVISTQPLLQEQIAITLHTFRKKNQQDYIALRSQQFVDVVHLKDICYLEGNNGCATVFLNSGKKIVTAKRLKHYEELLPGTSFLRPHQSYLVNASYIDRYHLKHGILLLKDGTLIPVSSRNKEMMEYYFKTL